jgi:hypothetical protein
LVQLGGFLKGHWQLIVLTGLIYALWNTDVIWPLRVLVVLFHELSHAGMALLTGGEVVEITFHKNEGGTAWTRGGNGFGISTAGYLGSLVIGAALLLAAVLTTADRVVAALIGIVMILAGVFYIRDMFALAFTAIVGGGLVAVAWWLQAQASDLILRVIGLASMLYVPWDIVVDTIIPRQRMGSFSSDAAAIAGRIGATEGIVGTVSFVISLIVVFATLRVALRRPSNISFWTPTDSR